MRKNVLFFDGGLYYTFLSNEINNKYPDLNFYCIGGDAESLTPSCFFKNFFNLISNEDNRVYMFPDLLRLIDLSGQKIEKERERVVLSNNLFDVVADCKKYPNKNVVFFGIGFENAAATVSIAILRALMAGHDNFRVYGYFIYLPSLIEKYLTIYSDSIIVIPEEYTLVLGEEVFKKLCDKYNALLIVTKNNNRCIDSGISNAVNNEEHQLPSISNQVKDYSSLLSETFEIPKDYKSLLLSFNPKYSCFDMVSEKAVGSKDFTCFDLFDHQKHVKDCSNWNKCNANHPLCNTMISSKGVCLIEKSLSF
ncbi:MAG: hypothetical protein ACEPOV_10055 [Hyphomicrobiales bacterium]